MAKFDTIKTAIDANINTNGNQAITGAVMNSVLKQMVDSTDAELTELESHCGMFTPNVNWVSGYILMDGTSSDSSDSFEKSNVIKVHKGETVTLNGESGGGVAVFAEKKSDGTYIGLQKGSDLTIFTLVAEKNLELVITTKKNTQRVITVYYPLLDTVESVKDSVSGLERELGSKENVVNKVEEINPSANHITYPSTKGVKDYVDLFNDYYEPTYNWVNGYILPNGTSSDSSDSWEKTTPISLKKGQTINYTGQYDGGVSAMSIKNMDGTYTSIWHTNETPLSYTAEDNCEIVLCRRKSTQSSVLVYGEDYRLKERIKTKNKYIDCLGDSLTMGSVNFGWYEDTIQSEVGSDFIVRNWGVGGEKTSTIMFRQGSDGVVLPNNVILPKDGSEVEIARTTDNNFMTSLLTGIKVTPLLMGNASVVNPCYVNGIECAMSVKPLSTGSASETNAIWTIKRNDVGSRDITISKHTPIYTNTCVEMGKALVSVIWMGANGGYYIDGDTTEVAHERLVRECRMAANQVSNGQYIIVGLHQKIGGQAASLEAMMRKEFGNKFYNIRLDCCTNMIYDAGITPTADDLEKMASNQCPPSLLYDGVHFKPQANKVIGKRLADMMKELGYL